MAEIELQGMSVLVVDDDPTTRDLLTGMLQELGISDIRRARNGRHALEILRGYTRDFAICDILMEEMGGIEFTKHVRTDPASANPYIPIVMLTGDARIEMVREARDAGANGFLAKPISIDVLSKRLKATLAENRDFIRSRGYTGPDRRRRDVPLKGRPDRRKNET
jgi:two-component system chemotaxis response regulator CheY